MNTYQDILNIINKNKKTQNDDVDKNVYTVLDHLAKNPMYQRSLDYYFENGCIYVNNEILTDKNMEYKENMILCVVM